MKVGLFPMVADVIHPGHILAIKEAKKNCDYLIVALHCNPEYKNPVQSIFERFIQLDSLEDVDKVIPYSNKSDAATMIASLDYDVYFLGEDYKNANFECKELLEFLKKPIHYLSRKHMLSSTDLKNRIITENKIREGIKCEEDNSC